MSKKNINKLNAQELASLSNALDFELSMAKGGGRETYTPKTIKTLSTLKNKVQNKVKRTRFNKTEKYLIQESIDTQIIVTNDLCGDEGSRQRVKEANDNLSVLKKLKLKPIQNLRCKI